MATRVTFKRKKRSYGAKHYNSKLNNRQKNEVKQLINGVIEMKSIDNGGNPTSSDIPTISKWFAVPQGTGQAARIGNEIQASHMELRYSLASADTFNILRVIVFQWREDDATVGPVYTDILYRPSTSVSWHNALYNYDQRESYKILYDKRHFVDADNQAKDTFVSTKIKVPHKKIIFNGSGATDGKNMIYVLFVSDSALAGHPGFMNQARLYYRDA